MKATGIVRRMDELGRVVIPKEIRKTMRINEGDSLEIYTDASEKIIFKKYSSLLELSSFAEKYALVLSRAISMPVLISDCDVIVAVSGTAKKEFLGKYVSENLKKLINKRENFTSINAEVFSPIENSETEAECVFSIVSGGDIMGSVIILKNKSQKFSLKENFLILKMFAELLGKFLED